MHHSQISSSALDAYALQRECALAGGSARHAWPLAHEQQFHAADIALETGATHQIRVQARDGSSNVPVWRLSFARFVVLIAR